MNFAQKLAMSCALVAIPLAPIVAADGAKWYRLDECKWVDDPQNDGDSFRVAFKGEEFVFRLYFVDAPEVAEGGMTGFADYFSFNPARTSEVARGAAYATSTVLKKGPFTVFTRWEEAPGEGQRRFYASVKTSDGHPLDGILVRSGWARIGGQTADLPDGLPSEAVVKKLKEIEETAKAERLGGWAFAGEAPKPTGAASLKEVDLPVAANVDLARYGFAGVSIWIHSADGDHLTVSANGVRRRYDAGDKIDLPGRTDRFWPVFQSAAVTVLVSDSNKAPMNHRKVMFLIPSQ